MLSKEHLDEIRKRSETATPGPWIAFLEGRDHTSGESFIARGINRAEDDLYLSGGTSADIGFVANARQDIPLLLDELEKLYEQLRKTSE